MRRGLRAVQAAILTLIAALAVGGVTPAFASGGGGPVAQDLLGSGSDTTQFMMNAIDQLYLFSPGCNQLSAPPPAVQWLDFSCASPDPAGTITTENYAHDQVHEAYFLGSGNGMAQLCDNGQTVGGAPVAQIAYARSSATPVGPSAGGSQCAGLHGVAYARDGISWEAFNIAGSGVAGMSTAPGNNTAPCKGSAGTHPICLTQSQLQQIFVTCQITNWSQVGGANVPISIYTPQAGSGTRKTWDKFLNGDSSHCITDPSHIIPENSNTGIPTADDAGAIFPFSYGIWTKQVHGTGGAVLGAVDNVQPTATTVGNGSFPYGRFLYNVYLPGYSPQAAINYVGEEGWICKTAANHANDPTTGVNYHTEIANAIKNAGFVPLPLGVIGGGDPNSDYCRLVVTS